MNVTSSLSLDPTVRWQVHGVVVGVAALFLALNREYREWSAPPRPNAALECVSAGLPDRSVVCSHTSTGYDTGYILFGDGNRKELRRTPPNDDEGTTPSDDIQRGTRDEFYHTYEFYNKYHIRLVVRTKSGDEDDDERKVLVTRPENIPEPIELEDFRITAYPEDVEPRLSADSLNKRLSYRRFWPSERKRTYAISITSDEGWHFSGTCQFEEARSRFASYEKSIFYPDSRTQATFRFTLRASSKFWFSEAGWLSGSIVCEQYPDGAIVDEFKASDPAKLLFHHYGVHPIVGSTENPTGAYKTNWSVKPKNGGLVTKEGSELIELSSVKLALINRDIIPHEERKNKAYIMLEKN